MLCQLLAVPSLAQGILWLVAWTAHQGQAGEVVYTLPTDPSRQSLQTHSGCFGEFTLTTPAPSPITLLPAHPLPLLPWDLSLSLWPESALGWSLDRLCLVPLLGLSPKEAAQEAPRLSDYCGTSFLLGPGCSGLNMTLH